VIVVCRHGCSNRLFAVRHALHEARGTVRVVCRIRPPLPSEAGHPECIGDILHLSDEACDALVFSPPEGASHAAVRTYDDVLNAKRLRGKPSRDDVSAEGRFIKFDKVFDRSSSQEELFRELTPLVQCALRGKSACVLAYGPSGSGKTFSLYGPPSRGGTKASGGSLFHDGGDALSGVAGLIPRAAFLLLQSRTVAEAGPMAVEALHLNAIEVYNDDVRDLMGEDETWVPLESVGQVEHCLERIAGARSARSTRMNEYSSRSHLVVRLRATLLAPWKAGGSSAPTTGILTVVDLAGSERAQDSGTARASSKAGALTETCAVNKSLSALSNVMMALAAGDSFVPFRDSKLTRILQPYLGGKSKTVLLIAVSPVANASALTLRALQFGARVTSVRG
jgi:kinesin family member C1